MRIESYGKVQLQLAFWIPLSLWAVHRAGRQPTVRASILLGAFSAAQVYSCLYYGVFAAVLLTVIAIATILTTTASRPRVARTLALGALIGLVLCWPLAAPYRAAARVVGERGIGEVQHFSAELKDFSRAPADGALYGDREHPGPAERSLFPGYIAPVVALVGLVPPVSAAAIAYAVAAGLSADLALGSNGWGYGTLFDALPPFARCACRRGSR